VPGPLQEGQGHQKQAQLASKEKYALDFIRKLRRLELIREDVEANMNLQRTMSRHTSNMSAYTQQYNAAQNLASDISTKAFNL